MLRYCLSLLAFLLITYSIRSQEDLPSLISKRDLDYYKFGKIELGIYNNMDDYRECLELYTIITTYMFAPLTIENVQSAIEKIGIIRPNEALIHMCRESGNFKSELARKANNLCGMRKAKKRQTFALPKIYKGYATYEFWIHSVIDYWIWQGKGKKPIMGDYRTYLVKRGYFPHSSK